MIEDNGRRMRREYFWFALALIIVLMGSVAHAATVKLLNVSYDPTRELPLEAEISRERYEGERFIVGQKVGLRFRRWQVYPAGGAAA